MREEVPVTESDGAGSVGEAVAFAYEWSPFGHEMWQPGVSLSDPLVYGKVRQYRNVRPLYARPVEEPGEVEQARDNLLRHADRSAEIVESRDAEIERLTRLLAAKDAALAETRERLEEAEAALVVAERSILEDATGAIACTVGVPNDVATAETLVDHIEAALAGGAREAGR